MKKLSFTLAVLCVILHLNANQQCDVILTADNFQNQCTVVEVSDEEVKYRDCQNENTEIVTISVSSVKKIYLTDGTIMDFTKGSTPVITKVERKVKQQEASAAPVQKEANAEPKEQPKTTTPSKEEVKPTPTVEPILSKEPEEIKESPAPQQPAEKLDIIITTGAEKIEAKILEVSKSEIRYKEAGNLEGPTFILEIEEIHSIIYANGKVKLYNHPKEQPLSQEQPVPAQVQQPIESAVPQNIPPKVDYDLARVENYSGIYVFTDCTPVASYEILGDVFFDKEGEQHAMVLPLYNASSGTINTTAINYKETPQYPDIRDGLIVQAVMANRQADGIIISISKAGEGRATIIKFKEGAEDRALARVKPHMGVFVFTDCTPVNTFTFVGKINKAGGLSADYNDLRDRLIKKVLKKYPSAQGIITRFVSGGYDSAEAIRF